MTANLRKILWVQRANRRLVPKREWDTEREGETGRRRAETESCKGERGANNNKLVLLHDKWKMENGKWKMENPYLSSFPVSPPLSLSHQLHSSGHRPLSGRWFPAESCLQSVRDQDALRLPRPRGSDERRPPQGTFFEQHPTPLRPP